MCMCVCTGIHVCIEERDGYVYSYQCAFCCCSPSLEDNLMNMSKRDIFFFYQGNEKNAGVTDPSERGSGFTHEKVKPAFVNRVPGDVSTCI